jgi:hypothetical protein
MSRDHIQEVMMASAIELPGLGRRGSVSGTVTAEAGQVKALQPSQVASVKLWALFGALVIAFEAYVLIKWVSGPNFVRVDPGPTPVPTFIQIAASVVTYAGIPAALWCTWNWVVKPCAARASSHRRA